MLLSTALFLVAAQAAAAQSTDALPAPAAAPEAKVLDAVVVSGTQPGPGLWRVSRDGREFWILGTLAPLPRRGAPQPEGVPPKPVRASRRPQAPAATRRP